MDIGSIRCTPELFFYQMVQKGFIVDGRAGGLVVGRGHSNGDIHLTWEDNGFFVTGKACMEGGEFILNAHAFSEASVRVMEINSFKDPQADIMNVELSSGIRIYTTQADPNDKLLWVEQGQFIVNRHATARHLAELCTINSVCNPFNCCDFGCFDMEVVELER